MKLVSKLLDAVHRRFNKAPIEFLAMRICTSDDQLVWTVADNVLTLTPSTTGVAQPMTIDLTQYTIQALASYINSQPGYMSLYVDSSDKALLSAMTLLDSTGNVQDSNGDHLYAFTNPLWAYLTSQAVELTAAAAQIPNAIAQMSTTSAGDSWLDYLGTFYEVPREQDELDPAYGPRITAEVLVPSSNNIGMALALELRFPGSSVSIPDAINNTGALILRDGTYHFDGTVDHNSGSIGTTSGFFDVIFSYDYSTGPDPISYATTILSVINIYRARGTYVRNLIIQDSTSAAILSNSFTLQQAQVFIYAQASQPAGSSGDQDQAAFFDEDDESPWQMDLESSPVGIDAKTGNHQADAWPWLMDEDDDTFDDLMQVIMQAGPVGALSGVGVDAITGAATLSVGSSGGNVFKFLPGIFALSGNVNGSSTNGNNRNPAEFTLLAAHGAPTIRGYRATYDWNSLEPGTTPGSYDFDGLVADYNGLQATCPGMTFGIYVLAGRSFEPAITYAQAVAKTVGFGTPDWMLNCGGSATIPNSYGSSSTTTYSIPKQQNGQCGFSFAGWGIDSASTYNSTYGALWDPGVARAFANLFQAIASHSFLVTAGPYAGQTFTFNTLPNFEGICDANEYSLNVGSSQGGFNPPAQSSSANAPTATNYFNNSLMYWEAAQAAFTKTQFEISYSFGFFGTSSDSPASFVARIPTLAAAGLTMSGPDMYDKSWAATAPWSTNGQQGYIGIAVPASGSTATLPTPTNPPQNNKMPATAQAQSPDFSSKLASGHTEYTQPVVAGICASAKVMNVQKIVCCMFDQQFVATSWPGYIFPGLQAALAAGDVTTTRPSLLP